MTKLYFSMRFDSANIEFHTLASNVVVRERIVLISSDAFGAFSRQPLMAGGPLNCVRVGRPTMSDI